MLNKIYEKKKALLLLSVFAFCGLMLTSVDGCEETGYEGYAPAGQGEVQAGTQQAAQPPAGGTTAEGTTAGTGVESEAAALEAAISALSGKNWKLQELRKGNSVMEVNRSKLEADGAGDFFTLAFAERVSGRAAPNRFTAPYQAGPNNTLTIQQMASTRMALIHDPGGIPEKDYFLYLTSVKSWKMNQGKLELYSADFSGKETILVYSN